MSTETSEISDAALFVTVLNEAHEVMPGVTVMVQPSAGIDTTDEFGTCIFHQLSEGIHQVLAYTQSYGSKVDTVQIHTEELQKIEMVLKHWYYFSPYIYIQTPFYLSTYSYVDSIDFNFYYYVFSGSSAQSILSITGESDGLLFEGSPKSSGIYRMPPLPIGDHLIRCSIQDSAGVVSSDTVRVKIISYPPTAGILCPDSIYCFTRNDTVRFDLSFSDYETPLQNLIVQLIGSNDGVIYNQKNHQNDRCQISYLPLFKGEQTIQMAVTDQDGQCGTDTVMIYSSLPEPVKLETPEVCDHSIRLQWSQSTDVEAFGSYEIYRTWHNMFDNKPYEIIQDPNQTTFEDEHVLIGKEYTYQVRVKNKDGYYNDSNEKSTEAGVAIEEEPIEYISAIITDLKRPHIYIFYNQAIHILNTDTDEIQNEKMIDDNPFDVSIDPDGDILYGLMGDKKIIVFDLNSQTVTATLTLPFYAREIEAVGNDRLVLCDRDQWQPIRLFDCKNLKVLYTTKAYYSPLLEVSPDGSALFAAINDNGYQLIRFNIMDNKFVLAAESEIIQESFFRLNIDAMGHYLYFGRHRFITGNLMKDDLIMDNVESVSPDGQLAFSGQYVLDSNNGTRLYDYGFQTDHLAGSYDNKKLYLYKQDQKKMYILTLDE